MTIEKLVDIPTETTLDIIARLGSIALWLQALGILVLIWIVLAIVNWLINRKRLKEVYKIKQDMQRIEGKIDKLLSEKK